MNDKKILQLWKKYDKFLDTVDVEIFGTLSFYEYCKLKEIRE